MNETYLLPEMVTAGVEAFSESERQEFDAYQTVVAVYLAMEAVRQMSLANTQETVH